MRRIRETSGNSGRKRGSGSQHRCINFHKLFVKVGCIGRGGRPPCVMITMTFQGERSPKGIAPVNTCSVRNRNKPKFSHSVLLATHLDHDHRERENVGFLAIISSLHPHLRRDPPHGEAILNRSAPYGVQVFGDLGEAKVRNQYVTGIFHEDVDLVGCQCGMKQDAEQLRTPFRSPCITLREWR